MRRLLLVLMVPALLAGGIWLGGHPQWLPDAVRDPLVADTEAQLYDEALDLVAEDYYREIDREDLVESSLSGLVESLEDPFSAYLTREQYARFREATSGEFEGVGMNVSEHPRGLKILTVFEGSPAEKAGLRPGDLIIAAGGRSLKGKTSQASTALIKGEAGTSVSLKVVSGKKDPRVISVERARVSVPVVESDMKAIDGQKVAYVALASFTSGAHGEVGAAVRELLDDGAEAVVFDLRNNGGGLLNEAVLVSSVFIGEGTIVTTEGRSRPKKVFKASGGAIDTEIPVVVLVNGNSASASEIVTGALQDRDRATVVGTKTFGKGVFQELETLPNGGALELTVGEYVTPGGRSLGPDGSEKGGIKPDVKAEDDPKTERDEALRKALQTVVQAPA